MAEQFCSYRLEGLGTLVQFHRTTLLSLCVLNFVFSPVAAFGNILVVRVLLKASSIPAKIKMFLSLAVFDLAVGLFAHLMYAVVLRMETDGGHDFDLLCQTILTLCYFFLLLLACASFLNVTVIAVDRLLVITLHLQYQELVTSKRVIIVLISIWIASVVTAFLYLVNSRRAIVVVIGKFVGILLTTVTYIHIYIVVRHHQIQIHSQLQQQN